MNAICYDGEIQEFYTTNVKWQKNNLTIHVSGDGNRVVVGKGCKLSNVSIIINGNENNISIGNSCSISNCKFLLSAPSNRRNVKLGDKCYIGEALLVLAAHDNYLEIGNDCMFSNEIVIRTEDGHPIFDLVTKELINKGGKVIIGNHCWLGERCYILKGVCLRDNTIVGAGSLVTSSYDESNIVIAGSPAKVVRKNVGWDKQYIQDYNP